MSKQLHIYALPSDVQRVMSQLGDKLNVVMLSPTSSRPEPVWLDSPIRKTSYLQSDSSTSVACCLARDGMAEIRFKHYPGQALWHVADDSEVITCSGCDFDGKVLVRGRLYCLTDTLVGQEIIAKRSEFVHWTDCVYRFVKGALQRSRELDAYVGQDAMVWMREGGRFASLAFPGRDPIFVSRDSLPKNESVQ